MDLELGLKIIKTRDDIAISEYRLAKDKAGPIFESRETNTMFILSAYLKGYKKNNINIKISEDGRKISISGEKPIQEILMRGWIMHKKEVDVKGFNKVFKIPDGVKLDRIKAKYDEEEWILNIFMPKLVKGICGATIEEVKEEEKSDHIISSVAGETSQKGSEESEVEAKESESFMEKKEEGVFDKKLDDANREISTEKMQKEVEEFKLGIEDGNGEKVIKRSELEDNVNVGISKEIGDTSQKEKEESKLKIADGKAKGKREEVGKVAYGEVMTSGMEIRGFDEFEINRRVGVNIPQNIRDTSQDLVEKKTKEKMSNDAKGNIIAEVIQKEMEESKSRIEDRDGESVKEKNGKEGYEVKKMEREESKQKKIGEPKTESEERLKESMKESSMEVKETMKTLEIDQNVADHIPSKIGDISQEKLKSKVQQEEIIESIEEKIDEGESEGMPIEASKERQKNIFGDSIQKDLKIPKIQTEDGDQDSVGGKVGKEGIDAMTTTREGFTDQLPKATIEESKGPSVSKMQESEDVKEAMVKREDKEIEHFVDKGEGEETERMHMEAKEDLPKETVQEIEDVKGATVKRKRKEIDYFVDKGRGEEPKRMHMEAKEDITKETMQEEIENAIKDIDQQNVPKCITEELPKQVQEQDGSEGFKVSKREEQKELIKEAKAETESLMEKVEGEESKKRTEQTRRVIEKKKATETLQKETEEPNIGIKSKEAPCVPDNMVKGNVDIQLFDGSKRPKFQEKVEAEDVKDDSAEIEEPLKKENEDKYEKIQVEAKGGIRKDTTWKEREGPKILTKEKDQHFSQEEMSKERFKESKATKEECPKKMLDSITDHKRKGLKETKIDEAKEVKEELVTQKSEEKKTEDVKEGAEIEQFVKKVKGEAEAEAVAKRKSEETEAVESARQSEIIVQTLQEEPEDKHPKVLERTTEQGRAKKKTQKTEMLPPKFQSKETRESKNESGNQDVLRPKKTKEVEREQTESTKKIAIIEDQVAKPLSTPRFPSTQQAEVEEQDKPYKGGKAKYEEFLESQKEDPTKGMKSLIDMKENQESKQIETLKPEIPAEKHLKKGAQVIKKDQFHKGQKARETKQEKTEGLEDKIDEKDQQYVQRDIEKVDKDKCIVESMEATQEKEHPMKSEGAEKKAEGVEAVSSFPSVMSEGVKEERPPKNEIDELQQKELSPLTAKMKSKDPLELEKPIMEGKVPRTKEYVAESRDREQHEHDYGKEGIEAPKIAAYQGAKPSKLQTPTLTQQSLDEEEKRSENVDEASEELPKKNIVEKEEMESTKVAKSEETKEALNEEHKKPIMKEVTPEFDKASEFKQVAEKMRETREKDDQIESEEVTPKIEITPKKGFEKSKMKEMSPTPVAIQRKEQPHELSWPSKDYKIPKVEEVQEEKGRERLIHAPKTTTSSQATAIARLKAKSNVEVKDEIDKPQVNQLPSPSKDDSKEEGKESIHSTESTTASKVAVADEVAEPSVLSCSLSTQQFEIEGKDKTDASHEVRNQESKEDVQDSTKVKTDQEVEQRETLQSVSPSDQEQSHGIHEIEEEKDFEKEDEAQEDSQVLEKQKESKKDITKKSKKLFVSLFIAGSALIVSGIFIFIRQRRARKRKQALEIK